MRRRALPLSALLSSSALAAPLGLVAYLRDGAAWVETKPGQMPRRLPDSRGAALLAVSPTDGTVAYLTGPVGTRLHGQAVPPLTPRLSARPYTASQPLSRLIPDPALKTVRARWLTWEGDGRHLIAGTDGGTVGWNLARRQSFIPNQTPGYQSTSRRGDVTATRGSVQSPDEPGVLLYGPGARPGTEVFTLSQPQNLIAAVKAQPQPALRRFVTDLDPRMQASEVNWTVTPPQVTPDGRRVYFASNVGYGIGSAGTTTSAVFEVDVATVRVRALGWLGTFSGSLQSVTPSPDGRGLLIVVARHVSNAQVDTLVYAADLTGQRVRELAKVDAPKGRLTALDSVCWLADSAHIALSAAYPRPQDLNAANEFLPPPGAFTLKVKEAATGKTLSRVAGATGVACGPK